MTVTVPTRDGATVMLVRRRGEERAVDVVLPEAGVRPTRDHACEAQLGVAAAAGNHQGLVGSDRGRNSERGRQEAERRQRLHQAETGGEVVGHHARRNALRIGQHQIDVVGFENQVANGEHQAVGIDQHARALTLAAEVLDRACVLDGHRLDADDGGVGPAHRDLMRLELGGGRGGSAVGHRHVTRVGSCGLHGRREGEGAGDPKDLDPPIERCLSHACLRVLTETAA